MFAAYGVAMALLARERTGTGQEVDLAMLDATVALLTYQAGNYFASGKRRRRGSATAIRASCRTRRSPRRTATSCSRSATTISGGRSARVAGAAATTSGSPPTASASSGYDALRPFVADRLRTQPRQHWIDALTRPACRAGRSATFDELFADPQLDAREMIAMVEHATIGPLKALGVPVKLSDTPGAVRTPPPTLGQHTDAVLRARSRIQRRRDRRVARGSRSSNRHGNLPRPQTAHRDDRARAKAGRGAPRPQRARRRATSTSSCRTIAVPLFRQVANALKADGYAFTVFTPSGSVRLMSDRVADDYIELTLDTVRRTRRRSRRASAARADAA